MKKILIAIVALMALLTMSNATYYPPIDCPTCVDGTDGKDGVDGIDGVNGIDGRDGIDGIDGKDGTDFNSQAYTTELLNVQSQLQKAGEMANQAVAGSVALSSIDFGSTCKGKTEVGFGIGASDSYLGTDYAGGVGVKHGFTDETAIVLKGWKSNNSHAVGAGLTYGF